MNTNIRNFFIVSFFVILNLFQHISFSQPQHNYWYFGRHAGLDFTSGSPAPIYGKTFTHEGTSTISSASGALLFYIGSDTVTPPPPSIYDIYNVYDASHNYMMNGTGLWGNTSTSQGPVIIPKPGACNQYMIFHVEGSTGGCQQNCSFFYSEVDMTLNGGLGAVTTKNNLIYSAAAPSVTEKVTITPHSNGTDYWVVVHEWTTDNFRVYPVTSAGVGAPVITSITPVHNGGSIAITGTMKFNSAGTKLAVGGAGAFYLYDFNTTTGVLSNAQNLFLSGGAYGVEFSPNGQYVYAGDLMSANLWQYDMNAVPISSSQTQIDPGSFWNKGSLQLAPDGKIYVGINSQTFVGIINSPNSAYPACNYVDNGLTLLAGTINSNAGGLPNFCKIYNSSGGGFSVSSTANNILCNGGSGNATVNPSGGSPPYTYSWNPTNQTSQTATGLAAGIYTVTITDAGGCSAVDTVLISEPAALSTTVTSTNSCASSGIASVNVSGGTPSYSFLWSNGNSTSTATGLSSGNYSVTITDGNGCTSTASVTINSGTPPAATISAANTTICSGASTTLSVTGGNSYSWNTGQTTSSIIISPTGTSSYTVVVDSSGCTDTATVVVTVSSPPIASAASATVCSGDVAILSASGGGNYSWNTGATTSSINVSIAGNYSVIVSVGNCSDTATASVTANPNPVASASSDTTITTGNAATLSASGGGTYLWSSGNTDSLITVSPNTTTQYCVVVANSFGCDDTNCVTVTVKDPDCSNQNILFLPNAFSPNDDNSNDLLRFYISNLYCVETYELILYNRWGEKVFETDDTNFQWDGTYNGKKLNTAVYVYIMKINFKDGNEDIRKGNISLIK